MTSEIRFSKAQETILDLLADTNFNNLNGLDISIDLRQHPSLWRSAYFTSASIERSPDETWVFAQYRSDFISLRDLPAGYLHLDTLLLLPTVGGQDALMNLTSIWGADVVEWIGTEEAGHVMGDSESVKDYSADPDRVILFLWWD